MIRGVGNDIIEIGRIRKAYLKHGERLLLRILTEKERQYCLRYRDPSPHLAGRFAAKEAIAKAFGLGFGASLSWLDIEILNSSLGQPQVYLAKPLMVNFQNPQLLVSISHCRDFATATALWSVNTEYIKHVQI